MIDDFAYNFFELLPILADNLPALIKSQVKNIQKGNVF